MTIGRILFAVIAAVPSMMSTASAQDAEAGKKVFTRCMACHDAEKGVNKVGPTLRGVIGRTAGSLHGFGYSQAMTDAGSKGLVWDETSLAEFLANPKGKVPGTKMAFPGLKKPDEIQDVIAYLKSVSE